MPYFVDLTHDDDDGRAMDPNVIDLTRSPSPPPLPPSLPPELPAKTPFCIGQLTVTALVLYPLSYIIQSPAFPDEWGPVRLQHEHNPTKPGNTETIHIISPNVRVPSGDILPGEVFGVVEQKVATALGPMMGKGLIRLEAKVQRGNAGSPILPLRLLVCTPKGNIPVVGNYLRQCGLLLDNPTPPWDYQCLSSYHYHNPHSPPPGGFNRVTYAPNKLAGPSSYVHRWGTPSMPSKSVEVQRSQVDEVFKSLKDGEELAETEPSPDVATTLYPHQKKGLTFLLEREREITGTDGSSSSLWQPRSNPWSHQQSWLHIITQKEISDEPIEAKGAILADDMGLGKTITCVSLIAATLDSAKAFARSPIDPLPLNLPSLSESSSNAQNSYETAKGKAKAARAQERFDADYKRASRIKVKSRASLIICPLSTVSNWEDQFREHWRGEVCVVGGGSGSCINATLPAMFAKMGDEKSAPRKGRIREGTPLRIYIYHGNARRPEPKFLADFDAVITTYATLASEYSKQNRGFTGREEEEEEDSSDGVTLVDEYGNQILKPEKPKNALKRKKSSLAIGNGVDSASPLQSIHWFRVVLDEAHSIKETGTVGSRASCDLIADRRLCLTGTPVQNKLDDVYALIKFLRLHPFDDKNVWTEFVGAPVKFGQDIGIARLQTIMKCITLRRTKETKSEDGEAILALPPRRDELRLLQFDPQEQAIYNQYFQESKAEFTHLSRKNEVMKNYVGILQKILRLRQICDHFELVKNKEVEQEQGAAASYESIVTDITNQGLTQSRACAVFALLRESAITQCVECGIELCTSVELSQCEDFDGDGPPASKRGRKAKLPSSRASTRASSPVGPRPVLTRCQHLFCLGCYRACVWPEWPDTISGELRSCSACQVGLTPKDAVEIRSDTTPEPIKRKVQKREKRQKGASLENHHPSTKVKALMQDLVQSSRTNPYSSNFDPSIVDVQFANEQKGSLDDNIVKTVVFSQWTSMLDKVEDALESANIHYDRLDGTMRRDERVRAMEALKHDPRCEVLLVSLKAGGVGLNLTAAQRVYLMDPYWNPAVENQAVDRIHRLGQTKPVTTVKLIIENTIEARLLEVQRQKTELANMTLGQHLSKAELMQRRMEELAKLFGT
ncbi:SNF2 family N-terminal domain containing protein [Amanita muscaria]